MTQVILSIKPIYCKRILSGQKKYEFRKEPIENKNLGVLIYATNPIKKFTGYFQVSRIIKDTIDNLWKRFGDVGGIEEKDFFHYYKDKKIGYALKIEKVRKFHEPIDPSVFFKNFSPPQTFKYLTTQEIDLLYPLFPQIKKITDYLN
ncbi:MAG: hypothetical protein ACTSRK_07115 [Promethearchaeota archaeon]